MFDLMVFKKGVEKLRGELAALHSDIEKMKQRREDLLHAPLSRDELAADLEKMVDRIGADYPRRLAAATHFLRNNPMCDLAEAAPFDIIGHTGAGSNINVLPRENLCWLFADQVKQRVRDAVAVMDWPEDKIKMPRAQRIDEIKKLDQQIASLEEKEKAMLAEINEAGIQL